MTPGRYNDWTVYKGATFSSTVVWKTDDVANNLAGYSAAMTITGPLGSTQAVTTSIVTTTLTLSLTAAQTALMTEGGYYSIIMTRPDNTKFVLLEGFIRLDDAI